MRQGAIVEPIQSTTGDEHDIDSRQLWSRPPERFTSQALDPVPFNAQPYVLAGDHQSEPSGSLVIPAGKQRIRRMTKCLGLVENTTEITRFEEARRLGETGAFRPLYGVSRARPRARRALITFLPPTVRILARKPWVRARLRLLGWNVLFIAAHPTGISLQKARESTATGEICQSVSPPTDRQERVQVTDYTNYLIAYPTVGMIQSKNTSL